MKKILPFIREKIVLALSLACLVIVVLLPTANPFFYTPNRDNGLFLFIGRVILRGGTLYRDVWDNKPPGIFYLDALGLWLGRDTRWGVWLIEFIFLTLAAWIGFQMIKKIWQPGAALFATLVWIFGISHIMVTGNLAEEYTLLFNFLALYIFVLVVQDPDKWIYHFLIGVTAALSFLFRANTIGVQISIGMVWIFMSLLTRQYHKGFMRLLYMALGALVPLVLVGLFLQTQGILYDTVRDGILYGLFYSGEHGNLLSSFTNGFIYVGISAWMTLVGYGFVLFYFFKNLHKNMDPVQLLLLIIWPLEIVLSGLSGRGYEHYFISWAPAMTLTTGYLFYKVSGINPGLKLFNVINNQAEILLVGLTIIILFLTRQTVLEYRRPLLNLLNNDKTSLEKTDRVSQYIQKFSDPNNKVLAWGGQTGINFMADRDTPTPYFWYPLYVNSPFTASMNDQFLKDLSNNKPELIIDNYIDAILEIPSINSITRQKQIDAGYYLLLQSVQTPNLPQVMDFINNNYDFETTIDQHDIYRLKGSKWKTKVPPPFTW